MPTSRSQYRVVKSFTDTEGLGKEYAKVEYKGIGETGYISRIAGPGDEITKKRYREKQREQPDQLYRVTIAANRVYETNQIPSPGWQSWTISFESTTYRRFDSIGAAFDAGTDKLDDIADLVAEVITPFNDVDAKPTPDAELSVEATEADGSYRPWSDAILTVTFDNGDRGIPYPLDVENERIQW